MAKKKRAKKSKPTPQRVKILIGLLLAVLVCGIAGVKFLQSARGSVFLLGKGAAGHYERSQKYIQTGLKGALIELGLEKGLKEKREYVTVEGKKYPIVLWEIACDEGADLVRINVAFTTAARSRGATVQEAREDESGRELRLKIGSGRFTTHIIKVSKRAAQSAAPRGEAGTERNAVPMLALVMDDFGYSANGTVEAILSLDVPFTISIIPSLPFTARVAAMAGEHKKEVILHLPMEPEEPLKYDVPPVTTAMSSEEIRALVTKYLSELPAAVGVNNHMGSKATQDERVMRAVLAPLKERRLYFLDSLTSPRSVAYNEARREGVAAARNDLFLDDDTQDPKLVGERLSKLLELAKTRGRAVGIAHPRRWTLEALRDNEARIKSSGVRMVFLSELAAD
jgi:polysaccharide deacetylase 2 family uncharacterized protein YibQ